ncbi:hypothetical protein BFP70_05230 [Thioclava sp. SK-1]|uniref:hypothetical protein n=1 Tax=Thioclava sp. SK-1 TaxID=1889770 RepID=UPI0008267113|nr:hypothetical protein [Thioclava sp. SK-1]OCX66424.1 hypothetical protein BFP70_05230 [Thioclava sp. SK-1]
MIGISSGFIGAGDGLSARRNPDGSITVSGRVFGFRWSRDNGATWTESTTLPAVLPLSDVDHVLIVALGRARDIGPYVPPPDIPDPDPDLTPDLAGWSLLAARSGGYVQLPLTLLA